MSWQEIAEAASGWVAPWILQFCRWDDQNVWRDDAFWCDEAVDWAALSEGAGSWTEI